VHSKKHTITIMTTFGREGFSHFSSLSGRKTIQNAVKHYVSSAQFLKHFEHLES